MTHVGHNNIQPNKLYSPIFALITCSTGTTFYMFRIYLLGGEEKNINEKSTIKVIFDDRALSFIGWGGKEYK